MQIKILSIIAFAFIISCKETNSNKIYEKNTSKDDTIITQINSNDMENDNSKNTENQRITFSELFNLIPIIEFSPKDLEKTKDSKLIDFRNKLKIFEDNDPMIDGISTDDLLLLINNNTFFDSQRYVDSSWLNYFLTKYDLYYSYNELMEQAIKQEDLKAVEILINHKYIFSEKDLEIANDTKENQKFELEENKKEDFESYLLKESKIDEILKKVSKLHKGNKIYDKDGYTNLREKKSKNSDLIAKINSGEFIDVITNPDEEDWYLVKTKEGKKGYIHKSRIISE